MTGMRMKTAALLALAAAQALFLASAAPASTLRKPVPDRSRLEIMADFEKNADAFKRDLEKNSTRTQKRESLNRLRETARLLKSAGPSNGDAALWEQYCDVILVILSDTETQIARYSWPAAKKSFARVDDLHRQMVQDAGLSRWERFRLWLKTVF